MAQTKLVWQSKLVLLVVMPFAGADVVLETHWWALQAAPVAIWTVGASLLLGLVTWKLRAATPWGALAGAAMTASLMFSSVGFPYWPWQTDLMPVLAVALLAFVSTLLGRGKKERLGTAESRHGRSAAQVSANLGMAAIVSSAFAQSWIMNSGWFARVSAAPVLVFAVGLAALAEAAADTASSEVGQVLGGRPRMITTLRRVEPGTDGGVSLAGTLAGMVAAAIVAAAGTLALKGGSLMFWIGCAGGVFGLLFDSLLGATIEERGWLNNDAVNFLSTGSAAVFALALLAFLPVFVTP
ncbi:MAG TPA: DUF92 domain-containing protein [Terracidiphilus sp.]|nr:DUF92 domain-containing protein [Terracidiphilus sp.]